MKNTNNFNTVDDLIKIFGHANCVVIKIEGEKEYTDMDYAIKQAKELEEFLFTGNM